MSVVPVLVLLALQPADDRIGHRREENLDGDLERPVERDDLQHRPSLPGPEKGNRIEQSAVDELADRGRADRTGPEMTPLSPNLHLRHDVAVHEVAAPVGDDRRGNDPPRAPEDKFQSRLELSIEGFVRIPRHVDHEESHDRREDHRAEASPDDFTRARVAIDLGQDVAEDVGDREEEVPGAKRQPEEDAGLARPDQIRAEQHRHEARHDEVVVAIAAGIRDEFRLVWISGGSHLQTRFHSVCGSLCLVQASPVRDAAPDRGTGVTERWCERRDCPAPIGEFLTKPLSCRENALVVPLTRTSMHDSRSGPILKPFKVLELCTHSGRYQRHVHHAFARAVQFDQHHGLPRAQHQLAAGHRHRERWSKNGRSHVGPGM